MRAAVCAPATAAIDGVSNDQCAFVLLDQHRLHMASGCASWHSTPTRSIQSPVPDDRAHFHSPKCASTRWLQRTHGEPAAAFPVLVRAAPRPSDHHCDSPSYRVAYEGSLSSRRLVGPIASSPAILRWSETAFERRAPPGTRHSGAGDMVRAWNRHAQKQTPSPESVKAF